MTPRDTIMALPECERLEYAVCWLETLLPSKFDDRVIAVMTEYSVPPNQARMLVLMHEVYPNHATKDMLYESLGCSEDADDKIVEVYISKTRSTLGKDFIKTIWGQGYKIGGKLPCLSTNTDRTPHEPRPAMVTKPSREHISSRWSTQDIADLTMMYRRGDDLSIIAEELGRTERACNDKIRSLSDG